MRIYYLLEDELKLVFSESCRTSTAVNYSTSGHLLAVGNYNLINIYNPYSFELIGQLSGHSGLVRNLRWVCDDKILVSSCTQGILYTWNVETLQRDIDHAYKHQKVNCALYDPEFDIVMNCCADSRIRFFVERGSNQKMDVDVSPFQITCVLLVREFQVVFMGTDQGTIRMYLWPFDPSVKEPEFFEVSVH